MDASAKVEIKVGQQLFKSGKGKLDPRQFPGIESIAKLFDTIEEPKDVWLVYEVGASPLSKHMFDVKGEFYRGERIYNVNHMDFYKALKNDHSILRDLIKSMA